VEYQREGYDMFTAMLDGIKEESVGFLFNLEVKTKEQQEAEARAQQAEAEAKALAAAQEGTARVLARQRAAQEAAAREAAAAAAPAPAPAAAPTPVDGDGGAPAPAPAAAPVSVSKPAAKPAARRSTGAPAGRPVTRTAPRHAAPPAPADEAPSPSGTGPQLAVKGLDEPRRSAENLSYSAPSLDPSAKESGPAKAAKTATVTGTKEPARNAPCPCGSGKKYKACHGAAGR
jgi:preprotein translocase subunit SecA